MNKRRYLNECDVFVSYAGEDREEIAKPLAEALHDAGLRVWFDQSSLKVGDSLSRVINEGLSRCSYGVVILSEHFIAKDWPQKELAALMARDKLEKPVVLPVWHKIDQQRLRKRYPILADRVAISTDLGIRRVTAELLRAMNIPFLGSNIAGLWMGNSGRLRLAMLEGSITGDYDWQGYEWVGHIQGECKGDIVHFEWNWELSDQQGVGFFELEPAYDRDSVSEYRPIYLYSLGGEWKEQSRRLTGGWAFAEDNLTLSWDLKELRRLPIHPWSFRSPNTCGVGSVKLVAHHRVPLQKRIQRRAPKVQQKAPTRSNLHLSHHRIIQKHRNPLPRFNPVLFRSAFQFQLPVQILDQTSLTPGSSDLALVFE